MNWLNPKNPAVFTIVASLTSGAAALSYEVGVIHLITPVVGGTVISLAIVTTAYLAGLCLGSFFFGRWADRRNWGWRAYAFLELGLAAAFLLWLTFRPALTHLLAVFDSPADTVQVVLRGLLASLSLLPATICLGGTLPVLIRCSAGDEPGRRANLIYGTNVFGACLGCLVTGYWAIPSHGLLMVFLGSAGLNLLIGMSTLCMAPIPLPKGESLTPTSSPSYGILFLGFFTGAVFFSAELSWTRAIANVASSNAIVPVTVIVASLLGISGGSYLSARRWVCAAPLARVTWMSLLLAGFALIASSVLFESFTGRIALQSQERRLIDAPPPVLTYLVCYGILVAGCSTALSILFPTILRSCSNDATSIGRATGSLLAVNTAGAVMGIWLTTVSFLPIFGGRGSLTILSIGCFACAVPSLQGHARKVLCCLLVITTASLLPTHKSVSGRIWIHAGMTHYRSIANEDLLFYGHDREATVAVCRIDSNLALTVNGLIVAETSQPDLWDLLLKAHIPLLLHESPERVAMVGLGAGVSLGAATAHPDVKHIDCVEISPAVVEAAPTFSQWNDDCLSNRRVHIHVADGRHFLASHPDTYDALIVDPVDPPVCNLYTREFYEIAKASLKQDGILVQWIPLFRLAPGHFRSLVATFQHVFPQGTLWLDGTSVLLLSRRSGPLLIDTERFAARATIPTVQDSLRAIGSPSAATLLATHLCGPDLLADYARGALLCEDDRPWLAYRALLAGPTGKRSQAANLATVLSLAEPKDAWLSTHQGPVAENARQLRPLLLELGRARLLYLQNKTGAGQAVTQELIRAKKLDPADLDLLSPFSGSLQP